MVSTEVETGLNFELTASFLGGKVILTFAHHDLLFEQHCSTYACCAAQQKRGFGALYCHVFARSG